MRTMGKGMAAALLICAAIASTESANSKRDRSGLRDFAFLLGEWVAHHRQLKDRLAGSSEWIEFDGRVRQRPQMDGFSNSGDNVFNSPNGAYRGTSLRFYDAGAAEWAVWWLDGRNPGAGLGVPIKGRFENGVGRFYSDDTLRGKAEAFSSDGGKTWETNWISDFVKVAP